MFVKEHARTFDLTVKKERDATGEYLSFTAVGVHNGIEYHGEVRHDRFRPVKVTVDGWKEWITFDTGLKPQLKDDTVTSLRDEMEALGNALLFDNNVWTFLGMKKRPTEEKPPSVWSNPGRFSSE